MCSQWNKTCCDTMFSLLTNSRFAVAPDIDLGGLDRTAAFNADAFDIRIRRLPSDDAVGPTDDRHHSDHPATVDAYTSSASDDRCAVRRLTLGVTALAHIASLARNY
jgi:hypothetical protein